MIAREKEHGKVGRSYRRTDLITVIPGGTVLISKLSFPWMMTLEAYSAVRVMALGNFSKRYHEFSSLPHIINTLF